MTRAKKSKRDDRVVTYVRVRPEEHARIAKLAEDRGYPHTIASVASEMISKGLAAELKLTRSSPPVAKVAR